MPFDCFGQSDTGNSPVLIAGREPCGQTDNDTRCERCCDCQERQYRLCVRHVPAAIARREPAC
jgi:hypothetical protein